jgi:hypothetical protein
MNIRHHRIRTLVKTDHRTLRVIRLGVQLQHRLHSPNKVRRHLRQTPLLLLPRLERVFFSVRRTVSSEMVATTPNSISRSASSCIVQHSRPSGGALQASAIRNASCLVSSLRWAPGRGRSVRAACSPSSAKRLRILRTVWGLILRASAMAGSVLPSSERRRMRARVRVRALACPLRSRVLRSLRSSSFSRTPSCFGLLVVWFLRAKCRGEMIPHKNRVVNYYPLREIVNAILYVLKTGCQVS